jgi:hypothetical protein
MAAPLVELARVIAVLDTTVPAAGFAVGVATLLVPPPPLELSSSVGHPVKTMSASRIAAAPAMVKNFLPIIIFKLLGTMAYPYPMYIDFPYFLQKFQKIGTYTPESINLEAASRSSLLANSIVTCVAI